MRTLIRRLLAHLPGRCRHDGNMIPIGSGQIAGMSFDLWRCEQCSAPIFYEAE